MKSCDVRALVVQQRPRNFIIGIVTERDFLKHVTRCHASLGATEVGTLMTALPVCVTPRFTLGE